MFWKNDRLSLVGTDMPPKGNIMALCQLLARLIWGTEFILQTAQGVVFVTD
jgi:hypothetical protein